ncbi:MAG: DegV family protein [Lachnospiraceae bacterium]|nr:DegV family protein [Lachnospiraceae bacterium]
MSDYVLSCCSTADLSKAHFEERDIHYVCFHYFLDGTEYPDDLGQSIPFPEFYKKMAGGAMTKTSQVNISEYMNYFTPFLEQGKDILHLTLSSGISGTYASAVSAASIARERFPERKIYIVDSLGASSGFGLMMDTLADLRDQGMDIDTLHCWIQDNRLRLNHWFFSTDLTYYVRGGRISKIEGLFGGLLGICPLLNMDQLGRLVPREKIRTRKRVIRTIVDRMEQYADKGLAYDGKCFISHSACYEDARAVADLVEARFPHLNGKVLINDIGTTIGSHTGPGTVALFFWGKERKG